MDEDQLKAIKVWCNWYSAKLDRIEAVAQEHPMSLHEDYSGAEQDLYEAFGCQTFDV